MLPWLQHDEARAIHALAWPADQGGLDGVFAGGVLGAVDIAGQVAVIGGVEAVSYTHLDVYKRQR